MPDALDKPKELAREAGEGSSERTPWLVLGAVHLTVAAVVLAVIGVVALVYVLSM